MSDLPQVTLELVKKREEVGKTFSEEGIKTFFSLVNGWLEKTIYGVCMDSFNQGKSVKKIRMKIEFETIIHGD